MSLRQVFLFGIGGAMKTSRQIFKLVAFGVALTCLFACAAGALTACDEAKKYHAEFYDDVEEFMNVEFLKENRVGQAFYPAGDFSEDQEYIKDEISPPTRTFIVTDEEEFARMFDEFPEKIDFNNQMMLVYMFVTTTPRNFEMTDLSLKEGALQVDYKMKMEIGDQLNSIKDDVMAYRRCFALIMDKTDIKGAEFEER